MRSFLKKSLWWKTLIYWIDKCDILKVHIGIAIMRQFQCVPTTYVTENKETYYEIYTYPESFPLALPL